MKLVIFDCDGVIVDSEGPVNELLMADLNGRGLALTMEDMEAMFIGGTMDGVAEKARELGAEMPDDWVPRLYEKMFARLAQGVPLIPGFVDVLEALEARGVPVWVASNGPYQKMQHTLRPHGIWDRLEGRILSREDHAPKPAPDMLIHAMQAEAVTPKDTVFVDDSPTGCRAGIAAGVRTIGFAAETDAARLAAVGAEPVDSMAALARALGLAEVAA